MRPAIGAEAARADDGVTRRTRLDEYATVDLSPQSTDLARDERDRDGASEDEVGIRDAHARRQTGRP